MNFGKKGSAAPTACTAWLLSHVKDFLSKRCFFCKLFQGINKKSFVPGIFVVSIICFMLSFTIGHARIKSNGAGFGFLANGESTDGRNMIIENDIVAGAGHFFRAKKDVQELLEIVELQDIQGIDFEKTGKAADRALLNINRALATYERLIATAENTPYNPVVSKALQEFDYPGYMAENGLNEVVFRRVRVFLENSDITGIFKHSRAKFLEARDLLNRIKDEVSMNGLPVIPVFWKLNETCDEVSLFGSYTARIFASLSR